MVDVLVMKYREQPRSQVRSLLPQMQFAESACQALLDEIIRSDEVARQRARTAPKAGNFGFDVRIRAGQRGLLPTATIGRGADLTL
jgi:hypothetical protein